MNSRVLLNLSLLLLVIALAGVVIYTQSANDKQTLLTSLHRQDINSIVIPRTKGDIVLKKVAGHWQMLSPYKLRAHTFRIERLIDLATSAVDKQYDISSLDLEKFGITEQSPGIRFNDTLIRYGSTSPLNNKRYVQVGQQLYLIDDELYPLINSQPSSFADLSLFDDSQQIREIILPELHVYKNDQGFWKAQSQDGEPISAVDADSIQTLVDNWQSAQAFGVHAHLQRKDLGRITIHLQDNSVIELIISDTTPWLILARPQLGIEYHFDKNFNDRLLKLPQQKTLDNNNHA